MNDLYHQAKEESAGQVDLRFDRRTFSLLLAGAAGAALLLFLGGVMVGLYGTVPPERRAPIDRLSRFASLSHEQLARCEQWLAASGSSQTYGADGPPPSGQLQEANGTGTETVWLTHRPDPGSQVADEQSWEHGEESHPVFGDHDANQLAYGQPAQHLEAIEDPERSEPPPMAPLGRPSPIPQVAETWISTTQRSTSSEQWTSDERSSTLFELQLGLYYRAADADSHIAQLARQGLQAYVVEVLSSQEETRYTVRLGAFSTMGQALDAASQLASRQDLDAVVRYRSLPQHQWPRPAADLQVSGEASADLLGALANRP